MFFWVNILTERLTAIHKCKFATSCFLQVFICYQLTFYGEMLWPLTNFTPFLLLCFASFAKCFYFTELLMPNCLYSVSVCGWGGAESFRYNTCVCSVKKRLTGQYWWSTCSLREVDVIQQNLRVRLDSFSIWSNGKITVQWNVYG